MQGRAVLVVLKVDGGAFLHQGLHDDLVVTPGGFPQSRPGSTQP